jgi:hypothetical protein
MRNTCVCIQNLWAIVLLSLTMFFPSSLTAQIYDLQIMVNGPWSYVADPNPELSLTPDADRIVLVAPAGMSHVAYVFSGTHATQGSPNLPSGNLFNPSGASDLAYYYLDFAATRITNTSAPPLEEPVNLFPASVPPHAVKLILCNFLVCVPNTSRYAISLPRPDYVTTYTGTYGTGFSESKIDPISVKPATPRVSYTTWMVLHYAVTSFPPSITRTRLVKQGTVPVPDGSFQVAADVTETTRSGISILLTAFVVGDDRTCDRLSEASFAAITQMWHLTEYSRFPVQTDFNGTQSPGFYDYLDCPEPSAASLADIMKLAQAAAQANDTTLKAIGSLKGALKQLQAERLPTSQKNRKASGNVVEEADSLWQKLSAAIALAHKPLGVPKEIQQASACTQTFIKNQELKGCPQGQELIEKYFDDKGGVFMTTVGSIDCHGAAISINSAF